VARRDRFDPFALEPLPSFREQLPIALELSDKLPPSRFLVVLLVVKAAPLLLKLVDPLFQRLLQSVDLDRRTAHPAPREPFDRVQSLENVRAQFF
jgi:hypothetical protein